MQITVKHILTKSRNPTEHGKKLENKSGELIQVVGDGWCRIDFNGLEWYVHELDFYIDQSLLVKKFQ